MFFFFFFFLRTYLQATYEGARMQNAEVVGYKFEGDWTAKEINNLNLPSTNKNVVYKNVVMQDSIVAGMVFKVSRVLSDC